MVTEIQYTTIRRVLDDLMDHPFLKDITLEQAIRYTIRFISLHGYSKLYQEKTATIEIRSFKGVLPCDLISITQVKNTKTGICLRSMTDTFIPKEGYKAVEDSFKTQGRILFTSFEEGEVEISYKSIPIDEEGFPLLIDNETYLNALEAYIKKQIFTIKFDTGEIAAGVLSNAQRDYSWASKLLQREFIMPSMSEMESISRMLTTTIKSVRHFDNGFKNLGDREYLRRY